MNGLYTVSALIPLASQAYALQLDRKSGPAFLYQAGQFAMVTVRDRDSGEEHKKALSFSSSPAHADMLEFGFERRGFFTQALSKLQPGDTVTLRAPLGYFTLPENEQGPLVMLAGGTGISPVLGILRDMVAMGRTNSVQVLYGSRSAGDILFRGELDRLTQDHAGINVRYTISNGDPEPEMLRGRMTPEMLQQLIPDMTKPLYFLSGPPGMVQDLIKILVVQGVDRDRILTEQYD